MILAPISVGELLDKITILEIKASRLTSPDAVSNVRFELAALERLREEHHHGDAAIQPLVAELSKVNEMLWEIEDELRLCESEQDFGERFVLLARSVYLTNDRRAAIKREINERTGSKVIEEKSYAK